MPAGKIRIELLHRAGRVTEARVLSARPEAARVLVGKTPEQALATVPLLFSLCGNAQSHAALLACRAALGLTAEPEADAARELLVSMETLREHSWRILLDWPKLLGRQADKTTISALLKIAAQFRLCLFNDGEAFKFDSRLVTDAQRLSVLMAELTALTDSAVFDRGLKQFYQLDSEAELRAWLAQSDSLSAALLNALYDMNWQALGDNDVACLPTLDNQAIHRQLQQEDLSAFCRAPQWQGQCYESTPLNRQQTLPLIAELQCRYGNGLLVRFAAVLQEVANGLLRIDHFGDRQSATGNVFDGIALAQVQAARGLLIHRLALRQGQVYDYRIIAPTEWNFHPVGVVAQGLINLSASDTDSLRRQAEWLINAVDPCVAYDLNLIDE